MDLDKFIEGAMHELLEFRKMWGEKNKEDSEVFPINLDHNEWWEHFIIYSDSDK